MDRKTDIRNIVVTTSSGKHVSDTQMLKGEASPKKKETNDLSEHTISETPKGPFGGLAKH